MPLPGRELKYALNQALQYAARFWLIDQRDSDLPDDLLVIGDYEYEIQELEKSQFVIRAKPLDELGKPANKPALFFEVSIRGGG